MSGGGITWTDNGLLSELRTISAKTHFLKDDAYEGAKPVLAESDLLVPKESGDLAAGGVIRRNRGGNNTVAITYSGPYARWIHEHLHFKHPHGGQAKFLETAMLTKGGEFVDKAGEHWWGRLT